MIDNRFEENNESVAKPTGTATKVLTGILIGFIVCLLLAFIIGERPTSKPEPSSVAPLVAVKPAPPPESKEDYIASTRKIGLKGSSIFIKDFIKSPDKYKDERVRIRVKVTDITEKNDQTLMNVALTTNYDPGIVLYQGSLKVYNGDIVEVYGEVYGSHEGQNRMGATMSWPTIVGKYVKKLRSGDDE